MTLITREKSWDGYKGSVEESATSDKRRQWKSISVRKSPSGLKRNHQLDFWIFRCEINGKHLFLVELMRCKILEKGDEETHDGNTPENYNTTLENPHVHPFSIGNTSSFMVDFPSPAM